MRRSGSPEVAYDFGGMTADKLIKTFAPDTEAAHRLIKLSITYPVILWVLGWIVSMTMPHSGLTFINMYNLMLAGTTAYAIITQKEQLALGLIGTYWMLELWTTYMIYASPVWANYIGKVLALLIFAYVMSRIFENSGVNAHNFLMRIRPFIKIFVLILTIVATLVLIVLFFMGIKENYTSLSVLAMIPTAILMLSLLIGILSDNVSQNTFAAKLAHIAPLLMIIVLIIFGIVDGAINFLVDAGGDVNALITFFRPLLTNFLHISFIIPAYFILNYGVKYPIYNKKIKKRHHESAPVADKEATAEVSKSFTDQKHSDEFGIFTDSNSSQTPVESENIDATAMAGYEGIANGDFADDQTIEPHTEQFTQTGSNAYSDYGFDYTNPYGSTKIHNAADANEINTSTTDWAMQNEFNYDSGIDTQYGLDHDQVYDNPLDAYQNTTGFETTPTIDRHSEVDTFVPVVPKPVIARVDKKLISEDTLTNGIDESTFDYTKDLHRTKTLGGKPVTETPDMVDDNNAATTLHAPSRPLLHRVGNDGSVSDVEATAIEPVAPEKTKPLIKRVN